MKRSRTDNKICRYKDIQQLFASAFVSVKGARLFYRENSVATLRVLITPGRKYGNAVKRNYVKRIGRDIVRNNKSLFNSGYDLALVFYSGNYNYADRAKQLLKLLQKTPVQATVKEK